MPRSDRLSPSGVKLLQEKHLAILSTIMRDGSPQATPVWVDVEPDGSHILINTVEGHILLRLLTKLDEIRRAMGNDRVFDVIGTLLTLNGVNVEDMLREFAKDARIEQLRHRIAVGSRTAEQRLDFLAGGGEIGGRQTGAGPAAQRFAAAQNSFL